MTPAQPPAIRLCLDLNVWVADFLAAAKGRRGSSSTWLVNAVRDGACPAGPLQLVISFPMLDRLAQVLRRGFAAHADTARDLTAAIGAIAAAGPAGEEPHIVLGGTGVLPMRDAEDQGVLETALAGKAHLLATANLADFPVGQSVLGKARVYTPPQGGTLLIAHPDHVANMLRRGSPLLSEWLY